MPGFIIATAREAAKITTAKIVTAICGIVLATADTIIIINDTRITAIHNQKLIKHLSHLLIHSPPPAVRLDFKTNLNLRFHQIKGRALQFIGRHCNTRRLMKAYEISIEKENRCRSLTAVKSQSILASCFICSSVP